MRFVLLESDFAINVINKYLFYLSVIPDEVELIRIEYSDFPEHYHGQLYRGILNLKM